MLLFPAAPRPIPSSGIGTADASLRYRIEMVQITFGYGLRWFIRILYNFLRSLSIENRKIPLQIHIASANQKMEQCTRQMPTYSPSTSAEIPPAGAPAGFESAAIIGFSIRRYTAVPLRPEWHSGHITL